MSGKVFNEKCVITGEPARYRDPATGQPYATLAAFKILRERFAEQVCSCGCVCARVLHMSMLESWFKSDI